MISVFAVAFGALLCAAAVSALLSVARPSREACATPVTEYYRLGA